MTDAGQPTAPGRPGPTGAPNALREAFGRALRDVLVLVAVVTVVGSAVGYLISAERGLWGALLGAAITLVFSGSTILAMLKTAGSSATVASAALVGTWIGKMLLLVVALGLLRQADFYDRGVFVVVLLVGVLGSVYLDYRAVSRARVPYVDPRTATGDGAL